MSDLTVVIAAYNAASTIAASVRSALQVGADEVVVVDDGSSDETAKLASTAGARVLTQPNAGAATARRNGAANVSSDYLVFLDADDELVRDGVVASIRVLDSDPSIVAVGGRVVGIDARGGESLLPKTFETITTARLLQTGFGAWPPGAAVMRTSAWKELREVEPLPLDPPFAEDFESLIRMTLIGAVSRHDEVSLRYRMFGGKSVRSARRAIECKEQLRDYYANFTGIEIHRLSPHRISAAAFIRLSRAAAAEGKVVRRARYFCTAAYYRLRALATR